MKLKKTFSHFFTRPSGTRLATGLNKAGRAGELNRAISGLWQAQGTYSKADFQSRMVPLYTALLKVLQKSHPGDAAEQILLDVLHNTAAACRHRWSVRLPMKRPGSDYRKYEIIYTDALVIAMAVGCLCTPGDTRSPEQLARQILPEEGFARLRADPLVWEDWLGYFQQSELGGLYAVSVCATRVTPLRKTTAYTAIVTPKMPPAGSGRAMLAAIRTALADGSLSCNRPDDAVQVDREGRTFLEHPKILTWCIDHLALENDLKKTKNRFSRLKEHKRSKKGHQLYYGSLGKHDRRRIGYVLENPQALWQDKPPPGRFVIENVSGTAVPGKG